MIRPGAWRSISLESAVSVNKALDDFPSWLGDPRSLELWDRSVAHVDITSTGGWGVGSTFTTVGHPRGGRPGRISSYRVRRLDRTVNEVELVDSPVFERAVWTFSFVPQAQRTKITCRIDLRTRPRYVFLAWLLKVQTRAIQQDLDQLKRVIEHG